MRKVEITNPAILKILKQKRELSEENQKLLKQMEELEKQYNKNISKNKRADEKSRPKIQKLVDQMDLGEYEELSRVREKNGKWSMEIVDRLEEFKQRFKKAQNENTKN